MVVLGSITYFWAVVLDSGMKQKMLSAVILLLAFLIKFTFLLNTQLICLLDIKNILMKIKQCASNEILNGKCMSRFFLDLDLLELVGNLW